MSKQAFPVLTLTIAAAATLTADRFVTIGGAVSATDSATSLGVVKQAAVSGDYVTVDVMGTTIVEAGAAITKGDALKVTTGGKVITWATSGLKVGIALQASAADGNFIEVLLTPISA